MGTCRSWQPSSESQTDLAQLSSTLPGLTDTSSSSGVPESLNDTKRGVYTQDVLNGILGTRRPALVLSTAK